MLTAAIDDARRSFGPRLLAGYALGSLAHGGFSAELSDVDLGLVLADPLSDSDGLAVADLVARFKATGDPLAGRLSVFWGSKASLTGKSTLGRFPPVDRLDLLQYGRLLEGKDLREGLPVPTQRELVVAAAWLGLEVLDRPDVRAELISPEVLYAHGPRPLTKRVLFPVRFLYTARTGKIGPTDAAVEHYLSSAKPAQSLVAAALRWRETTPSRDEAISLLSQGLKPLYLEFIDDYLARVRAYGEVQLASLLEGWRARIAAELPGDAGVPAVGVR